MKVIVFNVPTSGHVDPSLPLAAELVNRGHEVIYYLTQAYRVRVEETGAKYRETPGIPPDYFDAVSLQFNPVRLATQLLESTYTLLPHLTEVVAAEKPDYIIADAMCTWGHLTAAKAAIPIISSMSLIDVPPSYLPKSGHLWQALALLPRLLPWLKPLRTAMRRLQKEYGIKFPSFTEIINAPGDLTLSYTSAQIFPQADKLMDTYLFIGPAIDTRPAPFPFEELDSERPLIYITLGTVFNNNPTFFQNCIEAFKDSAYQVVISLGRRLPVSQFEPLPSNFIICDYVPQFEILQRAALFISHGGVNSIHQALYHGVPLLIVPQQLEHALVSARMAELGAAIALRQPTVKKLQQAAFRLLNDNAYRHQAETLGMGLKTAGGVSKAVDWLEAHE
jgi:MGT family glycosyltransferase